MSEVIGIGKILGAQFKLLGHIQAGRIDRVKDYLLVFAGIWPQASDCPVDREVLHQARLILEGNGWKFDCTQVGRGLVLIAPNGADYSSHARVYNRSAPLRRVFLVMSYFK